MKKQKLNFILLFSAMLLSTQYYGQIISGDSTCLTKEETDFFIEQCYTVKDQSLSLLLNDKTISALEQEVDFLHKESKSKDKEIDLRLLQNKNCQSDKTFLSHQLHSANRERRLFKTGFLIVGGFAILELGYIAIRR